MTLEVNKERHFLEMTAAALILIAATFCLFEILKKPLFLDEFGTFWVVSNGIHDVFTRALTVQGQSPFFYLCTWILVQLFGSSEIALRLISPLSVAATCFFIARLSIRLVHPKSAIYSVIFFFCLLLPHLDVWLSRPYALGLFFTSLSTFLLLRWLEKDCPTRLVLYALSAGFLLYTGFILFTIVIFHQLVIAACYILSAKQHVSLKAYLSHLALLALIVSPTFGQLKDLLGRGGQLVFLPQPGTQELARSIFGLELALALFFYFLARVLFRSSPALKPYDLCKIKTSLSSDVSWLILIFWVALPPIILFTTSHVLGSSVFISRYLSVTLPGLALLVVKICFNIQKRELGKLALLIISGLLLFLTTRLLPMLSEDWKSASIAISEDKRTASCTILLSSGFIESAQPALLQDPLFASFIGSPLLYYKIPHPFYLLPFPGLKDSESYLETTVIPLLNETDCVYIILRNKERYVNKEIRFPLESIIPLLSNRKFRPQKEYDYGMVKVIRFEQHRAR
jgi:hypothetical protein